MQLLTNLNFKTLFEAIPDSYVIFKADFTIVACSNAYLKTVGLNREGVIGKKLEEVFPDNPANAFSSINLIKDSIKHTIELGKPYTAGIVKYDIARNDGTFENRFWRTLFIPVRNDENEIAWVIARAEDVTEMMALNEEKLLWKEKFSQHSSVTEELRMLSGHLQNTREKEKAYIAKEVHDQLGQQLSVIKMQVHWLIKKLNISDAHIHSRVNDLMEMINGSISSMRRISAELRPSILDDMGVIAAVEWQLTEFEKISGIHTFFSGLSTDPPLEDVAKTSLFRIVQESLTNVARHAKAKNLWLSFQQKENELLLTIKDDGIGFRQEALDKRKFGLISMKERTMMLGGKYEIKSTPQEGTTVKVTIPLVALNLGLLET